MKKQIIIIILTLCSYTIIAQNNSFKVDKIWDNGTHSAFTSIIKYGDAYYCTFREGESHIFDSKGNAEGKVRILKSDDGVKWVTVALLGKDKLDLRDPKLSITPDNKLMVIIGGSKYENKKLIGAEPHVSFSKDGKIFSEPLPVKIKDNKGTGADWIWRVTWHNNTGYATMYSVKEKDALSLLSTTDGENFDIVTKFNITDFPNEATIRFDSQGDMYMMVRREIGDKKGYWGKSSAPYTDWEWKTMDFQLGGPDFIFLDNDFIVAGTRSYFIPSRPKTILLTGDRAGKFEETLVLPSGGDTSYPGFIRVEDELWVSYYSTHQPSKRTSIYLAKIPLSVFSKQE